MSCTTVNVEWPKSVCIRERLIRQTIFLVNPYTRYYVHSQTFDVFRFHRLRVKSFHGIRSNRTLSTTNISPRLDKTEVIRKQKRARICNDFYFRHNARSMSRNFRFFAAFAKTTVPKNRSYELPGNEEWKRHQTLFARGKRLFFLYLLKSIKNT